MDETTRPTDIPGVAACVRCHRPPRQALRRRLCEKCYLKAYRVGLLRLWPTKTSSTAETHARWAALAQVEPGLSIRQSADRLGLEYETLRVALSRHRRNGSS